MFHLLNWCYVFCEPSGFRRKNAVFLCWYQREGRDCFASAGISVWVSRWKARVSVWAEGYLCEWRKNKKSSMVGRYGSLNQKGLPPQLFKPMRDSCHSFLSCDPCQRNGPMREGVKGHSRWRLLVGVWFGVGDRWPPWKKGSRAHPRWRRMVGVWFRVENRGPPWKKSRAQ